MVSSVHMLSKNDEQVQQLIKENEYLTAAAEDSGITTTMYYYDFIILLVVMLFLSVLLLKLLNGYNRNYIMYLCVLSIVVLFLVTPYFR